MRILVCDDERHFLNDEIAIVVGFAKRNDLKVEITRYQSVEEMLFELEDNINDFDLALLDVNFPGKSNGISGGIQLREKGFIGEIIFVTHDKDAVFDAFDCGAFHYILKGITTEEKAEEIFLNAVNRIEARKKEIISLTCAGERRNIPIEDISYFEVDNRIIRVHYGEGETFEFYSTIGKLQNSLIGKGIERAHRAFLVSLSHVGKVSGSEITMKDGTIIPMGRTYSKEFRETLKEYGQDKLVW